MRKVKLFEEYLNESTGLEQQLIDDFKFEIKAVKCKVYTDDDDPEALKFDMVMSNGDKISFDSFYASSPNPEDSKNDFEKLKINGKDFKFAADEERQNFYGVMDAYRRYLKIK